MFRDYEAILRISRNLVGCVQIFSIVLVYSQSVVMHKFLQDVHCLLMTFILWWLKCAGDKT